MARSHARVKVEAWEPGGDFRRLTLEAQWAYVMLLSQPEINNCGVLPYRPERWVEFADGLTRRALNRALRALVDGRFVVLDAATRELLVRTFVKHDRIEAQPNLVLAARRQYRELESPLIRDVLAEEYPHLFDTGSGAYAALNATASGQFGRANSTDPGQFSLLNDPSQAGTEPRTTPPDAPKPAPLSDPDTEPLREPLSEGGNAHARTAPAPAPSPTPRTRALGQDPSPEDPAGSAAAAPIGETELRQLVAALPGADSRTLHIVEPLARQIPRPAFLDLLHTVEARQARNPIGLLVRLLQTAITDARHAHIEQALGSPTETLLHPEPVERLPLEEALDLNVRRLAENGRDWPEIADFVTNAFGDDHLAAARTTYDDTIDPEPNAA
jgi:hypothetical protein